MKGDRCNFHIVDSDMNFMIEPKNELSSTNKEIYMLEKEKENEDELFIQPEGERIADALRC